MARSLTRLHRPRVHPGSGEHPRSPYRDCLPQPQFAWDPEPKTVGLYHHWLPYLRLGSHCIVTLGFFSCTLGDLPKANGHLFDSLRDRESTPPPDVPYWRDAEPRGLCR